MVKGSKLTPFQFVGVRLGVKYYSHKKPMSTHFPNAGKGTGHWCQKTTSGYWCKQPDLWKQPPQRKDSSRCNRLYYHLPPRNANRSLDRCIITHNNTSKA